MQSILHTAATQTATDPRSSASVTYKTVLSGYVPDGSHTVSPSVVEAPWTSVLALYAPYDLRAKHFLSLRVSSTLVPVPTSSATISHARYTGASTLTQNQPMTTTKTCLQHTQHGGNEPKSDTPTTDATTAPLASHSVIHITHEKKCHPQGQLQGGTQLACDSNGPPTPVTPQSSDSERYISPARTCQS